MELIVRPVDVNYLAQTWPLVKEFLAAALATIDAPEDTHCYNIHHVQAFITNEQWLLTVIVDKDSKIQGAITVSFVNYPNQRVAFVTLCGGKSIANKDVLKQLSDICRMYGVTKLQAYANGSRLRLWEKTGFKKHTTLIGVDL